MAALPSKYTAVCQASLALRVAKPEAERFHLPVGMEDSS